MVSSVSGKVKGGSISFNKINIFSFFDSDHISIKHVSTERYLTSQSGTYESGSFQQRVRKRKITKKKEANDSCFT